MAISVESRCFWKGLVHETLNSRFDTAWISIHQFRLTMLHKLHPFGLGAQHHGRSTKEESLVPHLNR